MSKGKSVEIIIPVYNTSVALISKCIDSIQSQTYNNIIITIIDDGTSNEDTLNYLKKLKSNYSNLSIIAKNNGGVSSARNVGLDNASADYILFLDADDYISKNYVEALVKKSQDEKVDIVYRKTADITEKGTIIRYDTFPKARMNLCSDMDKLVYRSYILSCHGALIRTNVAKRKHFDTNLTIGEDTDYMIEILGDNDFSYCDEAVYYYVISNGSAMRSYSLEKTQRYFDDVNKMVLRIEKRFPEYSEEIRSVLYNNLNNACDRLCRSKIGMKRAVALMKEYKSKIANIATVKFEKKRIDKRISINLLVKDRYVLYYLFNSILLNLKRAKRCLFK